MESADKFKELREAIRKQNLNPKAAFERWDANKDGSIDRAEFATAVAQLNLSFSKEQVDELFTALDLDNSNSVSIEEFFDALNWQQASASFRALVDGLRVKNWDPKTAFQTFDSNKDGDLDLGEWKNAIKSLNLNFTEQQAEEIFKALDTDGSNTLSIEEFAEAVNFKQYMMAYESLRQIADAMKAKKLSPKQAFALFDTNKDGSLDLSELTKLCEHIGLSLPKEKIDFVFRAIDLDNSQAISIEEFYEALQWRHEAHSFKAIVAAMQKKQIQPANVFAQFDINKDGSLDVAEFTSMMKFLGFNFTNQHIESIFQCMDTDQNGTVNSDEFMEAVSWQSLQAIFDSLKAISEALRAKGLNPKAVYTQFDSNHDFLLSIDEFKKLLQSLGLNYHDDKITSVFSAIDTDNSGAISQEEFYEAMNWKWEAESFRQICEILKLKNLDPKEAFKSFDINHDNMLDLGEFIKAIQSLNLNFSEQKIESIFKALDTDGSNTLSIDEFVEAINWKFYNQAVDALKQIADQLKALNMDSKTAFDQFDTDKNGSLDINEFTKALEFLKLNYPADKIKQIFQSLDIDNSGNITIDEFFTAIHWRQAAYSLKAIKEVMKAKKLDPKTLFECFDTNKDGNLDVKEITESLKCLELSYSNDQIETIFKALDTDGSGGISIEELTNALK